MAVGGRDADTQQPGRHRLRAHHFLLGFHQLREGLAALLEKRPAAIGQADAAGGAHKQPGTQALFQPRDAAAHRRRRHARHLGGGGKAAGLGSQAEQLDAAQLQIFEMALHDGLHRVSAWGLTRSIYQQGPHKYRGPTWPVLAFIPRTPPTTSVAMLRRCTLRTPSTTSRSWSTDHRIPTVVRRSTPCKKACISRTRSSSTRPPPRAQGWCTRLTTAWHRT